VIAYKFLGSGRVATYSGVSWPEPGTWLEVRGEIEPCVSGIHALRAAALLGWIDDELWTCELGGTIEDDGEMLVAARGRLLARLQAWNESGAYDFARDCAARGRDVVVESLHADHADAARALAGLDADAFASTAPAVAAELPPDAAGLVVMAADTTALAEGRALTAREPRLHSHLEAVAASRSTHGAIAANVAFVIAHSTAGLHPGGYDAGFAVERSWQLDRLLDRLGLGQAHAFA